MNDIRFPQVNPVIRNGESVVELVQDGDVVVTINFTRLLTIWLDAMGVTKKPRHLHVVR